MPEMRVGRWSQPCTGLCAPCSPSVMVSHAHSPATVNESTSTGDMVVKYHSTKIFAMFFIMASVVIFFVAFSNILDNWKEAREEEDRQKKRWSIKNHKFSSQWMDKVFKGEHKTCEKERFVLSVLLETNVLDMNDHVKPLLEVRARVTSSPLITAPLSSFLFPIWSFSFFSFRLCELFNCSAIPPHPSDGPLRPPSATSVH